MSAPDLKLVPGADLSPAADAAFGNAFATLSEFKARQLHRLVMGEPAEITEGSPSDADFHLLQLLIEGGVREPDLLEELWRWSTCVVPGREKKMGRRNYVAPTIASALRRAPRPVEPAGTLAPTPEFPAVDDEALDTLPDPEWLIEGVLPVDTSVVLYGRRSTFKSFVLLDWLLSVQTGSLWLDEHEVRQGQAIYVAAEGWGGLKKRVRVWKRTHSWVGRAGLQVIRGSTLRTDPAVARLIARIAERTGGKPVAVIGLDTLNRLLPGIEENTPEAMGRAVGIADRLRAAFPGSTVVWVHHSGWDDQHERGHSSLGDGSDAIIHAEVGLEPLSVTLTCEKQKDADEFKALRLALTESDADGLTSLSVEMAAPSAGPGKPLTGSEQDALVALPAGASLTSGDWREASKLPLGTFKWARSQLLKRGIVDHERRTGLYTRAPEPNPGGQR